MPVIKVGEEQFEIASQENILATSFIHTVWVRAGKPDRLEGESAWRVMDSIMKIWGGCYPYELRAWKKQLSEEQSMERTPHEALKDNGGYFPIAYPTRLLQLIKVYFKKERLADHNLIKKFVSRYPILKRTKYSI
jgi:hypothetical protein